MKKLIEKMKKWTTAKKSLYYALLFFTAYTAVNLAMNYKGVSVDDTLTESVFDLLKTVIVSGGALQGAKIFKGEKKGVE